MKITIPQAWSLNQILDHGGVVPTSEWTNGRGRHTTRKQVPPHCERMWVHHGHHYLKSGLVKRNLEKLIAARPRVEYVIVCTNLRAARKAVRETLVGGGVALGDGKVRRIV